MYLTCFPLPAGWLVDVTGSYTATFLLSGIAMLASAFALSLLAAIRRCRVAIHRRSHSSNTVNGFNKEVVCHDMISWMDEPIHYMDHRDVEFGALSTEILWHHGGVDQAPCLYFIIFLLMVVLFESSRLKTHKMLLSVLAYYFCLTFCVDFLHVQYSSSVFSWWSTEQMISFIPLFYSSIQSYLNLAKDPEDDSAQGQMMNHHGFGGYFLYFSTQMFAN